MLQVIKVIEQIDDMPISFIGELNRVKVYGTVTGAGDTYDLYTFPISGGPDRQVKESEIQF